MAEDFFKNRDSLFQKRLTISLSDEKMLDAVATALNAPTRRKILKLLSHNSYTVWEIAEKLNMSLSNISFHIKLLQKAGLVNVTHNNSKKGNEKIVALKSNCVEILFSEEEKNELVGTREIFRTEIPIGCFSDFSVNAPCGIADGEGSLIGPEAQPDIFYSYRHVKAEIIWFSSGYLEYLIPNTRFKNKRINEIQISLELCSECDNYNNSFKSDITFYLNDKKIALYTSPGDFGGRRGKYTPERWPKQSTQFGMLLQIKIDENGVWLNQVNVNPNVTVNDFAFISDEKCVKFKIAALTGEKHSGGINLFGKNFGDFNQGIIFSTTFSNDIRQE